MSALPLRVSTIESVIAYGLCVGTSHKFEKIALPAIRAQNPTASVLIRRGQSSIAEAYNSLIEEANTLSAEALILLHDDVELKGDIEAPLERCLSLPDVAIVGAIGSRGSSFDWWSDGEHFGFAQDTRAVHDFGGGTHDVDVVDGLVMALSAWALEHLRFDADHFDGWHGYDADICRQAREHGKRVLVTDLPLFHHARPLEGYDVAPFEHARRAYLLKWDRDASAVQRLRWRVGRSSLGWKTRTALARRPSR